jgi:hypothetical protein
MRCDMDETPALSPSRKSSLHLGSIALPIALSVIIIADLILILSVKTVFHPTTPVRQPAESRQPMRPMLHRVGRTRHRLS